MTNSTKRFRTSIAAAALAVVSGACAPDTQTITPAAPPAIASYVTGAARAALNPEGRFALPVPGADTLSEQQATKLADAYLKAFGPMAVPRYQQETGIQFGLDDVQPCGRAYLAVSPYQPVAEGPVRIQRLLGPHWLVTFCITGTKPVLSVSVSALATDLVGRDVGSPSVDFKLGDFREESIRPEMPGLPVTPERAVKIAAEATGVRVAAVPVLLQPPLPYVYQLARWKLVLEQPAHLRGARTGAESDEQALYYGFDRATRSFGLLRVVAADRGVDSLRQSTALGGPIVTARRRADLPSTFEPVSVLTQRRTSP